MLLPPSSSTTEVAHEERCGRPDSTTASRPAWDLWLHGVYSIEDTYNRYDHKGRLETTNVNSVIVVNNLNSFLRMAQAPRI
jgi:hypothetical protein